MGRRSERRKNKEERTVGKEEGLQIRGKKKRKGNDKGG
jgi:hypothetical protein